MPTPRKAGRFGGNAAHHHRIMANLTTELILNGRIRTTHAKAKAAQPLAERMVTFGKRGDLASRRQARKVVRDGDALHRLFAEVGPANSERAGGYTRVLKLGPRQGDAAPMALLEFVEPLGAGQGGEAGGAEAPRRRWGLRRRSGDQAAEPAAAPRSDTATIAEPAVADEDEGEAPEVEPDEVEERLGAEDEPEPQGDSDTDASEERERTEGSEGSERDEA